MAGIASEGIHLDALTVAAKALFDLTLVAVEDAEVVVDLHKTFVGVKCTLQHVHSLVDAA